MYIFPNIDIGVLFPIFFSNDWFKRHLFSVGSCFITSLMGDFSSFDVDKQTRAAYFTSVCLLVCRKGADLWKQYMTKHPSFNTNIKHQTLCVFTFSFALEIYFVWPFVCCSPTNFKNLFYSLSIYRSRCYSSSSTCANLQHRVSCLTVCVCVWPWQFLKKDYAAPD